MPYHVHIIKFILLEKAKEILDEDSFFAVLMRHIYLPHVPDVGTGLRMSGDHYMIEDIIWDVDENMLQIDVEPSFVQNEDELRDKISEFVEKGWDHVDGNVSEKENKNELSARIKNLRN